VKDDGTGQFFIRTVQRDWLLPFSLHFGEMLYQLRAALDSCVYDAAVLHFKQDPPPDQEKWEFVFGANATKFEKALRRMEKIIPQNIRDLIEAVQPYKGAVCTLPDGGYFDLGAVLEMLNNWARIDRHRRLHLVGTAITDGTITVAVPEGMTVEDAQFTTEQHVLEHEHEILSFRIGNFIPGTKVNVEPRFTFEITVDETPRVRLQDAASGMLFALQAVRESFERHFGIKRN
jgi:hypothetical protein